MKQWFLSFSGASACIRLKKFKEAIRWCHKGLVVSFTGVNKEISIYRSFLYKPLLYHWYGFVYQERYMASWIYEFSFVVLKNISLARSLVKYISTPEYLNQRVKSVSCVGPHALVINQLVTGEYRTDLFLMVSFCLTQGTQRRKCIPL